MAVHDTSAAPGALETVRRFVNTLDIEDATDQMVTPDSLGEWLCHESLLDPDADVTDLDVHRARDLREALREAIAANHDHALPPLGVRALLNDFADRARLSLRLDQQGRWQAQPQASGVDGAFGELVAIVAGATTAGSWQRLKICVNDACRWAFYDHSRARSGRWCSMQVCGNRIKQQAWRNRQ